jgi:uncharacterized protein (DUF433 family)
MAAIVSAIYEHIRLDQRGYAFIADTTMKVTALVLAQLSYGWSAEELHFQFPYLTLGQIHAALAYYWDHQEALDRQIEEEARIATSLQTDPASAALAATLHARGRRA